MKIETQRRLSALERILVPPEKWEIMVTFPDGRIEQMTAKEFEALTQAEPQIDGIYTKISGNAKEAQAFFNAVRNIALYEYGDSDDE